MKLKFNPNIDTTMAYLSKRYATQSIVFYIVSLLICTLLYMSNALPLIIILVGVVSVLLFFSGSYALGRKWCKYNEKQFVKSLFWMALLLRVAFALFSYIYNWSVYSHYYESSEGDIMFYMPTAMKETQLHGLNIVGTISDLSGLYDVSDIGYMVYLSFILAMMGAGGTQTPSGVPDMEIGQDYVWLPILLKCIYGAFVCVFMYRIAKRHFGENVGRMTAMFCMLQFNMIWWCGSMMKETEMIFISCLFAERMDRVIVGENIKPWHIVITVLIGFALFTFRAALFMTAFAATLLAMVMNKSKSLNMGKKILAGLMIAIAMGIAIGDNIRNQVVNITEQAQNREHVQQNMEWRTTRQYGNQFAKYASATIFAPLIFTIPFPTMTYTHQSQEMIMMVNGGNYIKNVFSFFVIFALFQLLLSGQWRQNVFPIAYMVGYIMALVLSEFAQSGRFHMPAMPFLMMFAAYGLTMVTSRKHKSWYTIVLVLEVGVCIFWQYFKLKGQGLI